MLQTINLACLPTLAVMFFNSKDTLFCAPASRFEQDLCESQQQPDHSANKQTKSLLSHV